MKSTHAHYNTIKLEARNTEAKKAHRFKTIGTLKRYEHGIKVNSQNKSGKMGGEGLPGCGG